MNDVSIMIQCCSVLKYKKTYLFSLTYLEHCITSCQNCMRFVSISLLDHFEIVNQTENIFSNYTRR